ncbi:DUF4870 domain-containing protein [Pyrococcus furiosus DSM 3638]|uniref:DUF4870 domain-containing protein n=3 Tax=Pyrococcus furiosus TaxID=2261 RepID=A0A5C0XS46_PYRFU|nr:MULTISPECIES: DUF4870 domain-containing protein [Pyrococcus]AAL81563.1 hypothetical protein PF1439 [Pyrococcus furiosus DSM 3638]AFN04220.1 hypothetical protein PFC_06420 [Pyrococcus furiosus COM1]MDK2869514.1 hypothetical protein [Pyrococcus sp.]QEK79068.1 DUF4870 domain-containing protein [Pyrococcus furiosus DSM 3638]
MESGNTSLGLNENVEAALAYAGAFISGIVLLILEKESEFVRFHAMQSTVTFLGLLALDLLLGWIPIFGFVFDFVIKIVAIVAWIVGIVKAYQGERFKFPIAGDLAEHFLPKV